MQTYTLNICGLKRELPIVPVSDELSIASFVILGDTELVRTVGPKLAQKLPEFDVLISAEAKGIPLIYEVSRFFDMNYIVARKSIKSYMQNPVKVKVNSITTEEEQILCLNGRDAKKVNGKKVAIIDDVISSGASIAAIEKLVNKAGGKVVAKAAILAEGEAVKRDDIIYLKELPLFNNNEKSKYNILK
ncbi:phosphoribosyltransferase family protein [Selenihalanaerobacter shriftii]|uniref:Adenine phosphoribosyltransferase n=1 Tax=Selenihalanaerobacter shriftii TaxID=142842 RepID=A0A1T4NH59_9FIRM|nr:phosphoribosyltransferase family protein [Selenihalanaerobacter shriftii]SJZ78078.1 adenine phosphoribosyltransferase [Selenihalanaerobacter shriftii]